MAQKAVLTFLAVLILAMSNLRSFISKLKIDLNVANTCNHPIVTRLHLCDSPDSRIYLSSRSCLENMHTYLN